jgi:two-component system chemotaxis response regulator CheY
VRALVVDDSRAIRIILTKILSELGFDEVFQAGDGLQALDHLGQFGDPELVLVDWLDELLLLDEARVVYGVVIDPDRRAVDGPATEALRERLRAESGA